MNHICFKRITTLLKIINDFKRKLSLKHYSYTFEITTGVPISPGKDRLPVTGGLATQVVSSSSGY